MQDSLQSEDFYPLSFAQERLWFLDRTAPGLPIYNLPLVLEIEGPLDPGVLQACLTEVARRHYTLRTIFVVRLGDPAQVVTPPAPVKLPLIDLTGLAEPERECVAGQFMEDEARRPFDLTTGAAWRVSILRKKPDKHVLLITMHHIVSDAGSMHVFARELCALYPAFRRGAPSPLPELSVQFVDHVVWQRQRVAGGYLKRLIDYWSRQLEGCPPVLELPADKPRPAGQSYRGARESFSVPAARTEALARLAREQDCTPFMALLAVFKTLLYRYTRASDIVVGTTIANRDHSEIENLIGFFVNELPLRTRVGGEVTFRALLGRVRDTAIGAYSHQSLPFSKLVEVVRPPRSWSHPPIFQQHFSLRDMPPIPLELDGLGVEAREVHPGTAHFDLSLDLARSAGGLEATCTYNADLFDPATIGRLLGHYRALLESALERPDLPIGELRMLTAAELGEITSTWNTASTGGPRQETIAALFQAQVERTPDAEALVDGQERMSYRELNARANRLAHYLCEAAIGPDELVGVYLERSARMVVAILGVLKAGGAYLPLDPAAPRDRLAFLLGDSRPRIVVTSGGLADLEGLSAARVVRLDFDEEVIARRSPANLPCRVDPGNLGYVIYTSGSTGRPKSVAVEQRSIAALIEWSHTVFSPEELAGVLASTSICFDLSVFELFAPLTAGGKAILAGNALHLPTLPARNEITLINTVPSAAAELLRQNALPPSARTIALGGEGPSRALIDGLYATGAVDRVFNMYGPTEATVYALYALVDRGDSAPPHIGRPIANTQALVLDDNLQLVPVGVPGELCIGGDGLARGYRGAPDWTAGRFIPHPYSTDPGARLYRTGDLARRLPDGNIDLIGRLDRQVKIRGFRIEPGEIEAELIRHPKVREAVVAAREDREGAKQLVAYVVCATEFPVAFELRRFLKNTLPDYMAPAGFLALDAIPLTPAGKVDRQALAALDWARSAPLQPARARTPAEEIVAQAFAGILGLEKVGIHDDFFTLGGHSLLAIRLAALLTSWFGVEFAVRSVFDAPTPAGLAGLIGKLSGATPIARASGQNTAPLALAQETYWALEEALPGEPFCNISLALRLQGALDTGALREAVEALVRRHETLRTIFRTVGGRTRQIVSPATRISLPVDDLAGLPEPQREAEALALAEEERRSPLSLTWGPVLRVRLVRLAPAEHIFLLTVHHIVCDRWSITEILFPELATLYEASVNHQPSLLSELPVQYRDFSVWQREWIDSEEAKAQLDYWRNRLAEPWPPMRLPADVPRPANPPLSVLGRRSRAVPAAITDAVRRLSQESGTTLFMTLLAAFKLLLYRYSGVEDIQVGTLTAGRSRMELQGLIGLFANTLILRTRLSSGFTVRQALHQVRGVTLEAFARLDFPFEELAATLERERGIDRTQLFSALFLFESRPLAPPSPSGLTVQGLADGEMNPEHDLAPTSLDWVFAVEEGAGELTAVLRYQAALFRDETADRVLQFFQEILDHMVSSPDQLLATLPEYRGSGRYS